MAMLAEKRRKTKFVLNPVSKPLWMNESSGMQTGKKLMEKMGWSAGKGLGASEQGISEPLRSVFKQDSKGMGYKGHGDPFENLDHFNALLASLSSNEPNDSVQEFESLEMKSNKSRSRVHYKKFTRGKDLSKCSTNDLSCIVGVARKADIEEEEEEEIVEEVDRTGETESSHGVTTINSGSIADYFKMKMSQKKSTNVISTQSGTKFEGNDSEPWNRSTSEENIEELKDISKKGKEKELNAQELETRAAATINASEEMEMSEPNSKKKLKKARHNINEDVINGYQSRDDTLIENSTVDTETVVEKKRKRNKKQEVQEDADQGIQYFSEAIIEGTTGDANLFSGESDMMSESSRSAEKRKKKEKKKKDKENAELTEILVALSESAKIKADSVGITKVKKIKKKHTNLDQNTMLSPSKHPSERNDVDESTTFQVSKVKKSKKRKSEIEKRNDCCEEKDESIKEAEIKGGRKSRKQKEGENEKVNTVKLEDACEEPDKKRRKGDEGVHQDDRIEMKSSTKKNAHQIADKFHGSNLISLPGYGSKVRKI